MQAGLLHAGSQRADGSQRKGEGGEGRHGFDSVAPKFGSLDLRNAGYERNVIILSSQRIACRLPRAYLAVGRWLGIDFLLAGRDGGFYRRADVPLVGGKILDPVRLRLEP